MSVFTSIDMQQLTAFLKHYSIGEPEGFTGIEAGITNSNFFIDTETGRYVLTIVEEETFKDVEWFMQLLAFLHQNHIPCAKPFLSVSGNYTKPLAKKPATIVECLDGADKTAVNSDDCHAIGRVLAGFHSSCKDYSLTRIDSRGSAWRAATAEKVRSKLDTQDRNLLDQHMQADYSAVLAALPESVIHADLFKDNVLFNNNQITGIIDFYYACTGCMLYDLAITFNDWCRDDHGEIDLPLASAMLQGYQEIRPLELSEHQSWPNAVSCAALRFWLSRLHDLHFPPDALMTFTKDPAQFQNILSNQTPSIAELTNQQDVEKTS